MIQAVIGIDIGGTKIAAHILDATHQTLDERRTSTPATEGADAILSTVVELCQTLIDAHPEIKFRGIGVGVAGQIDPHQGKVIDGNDNILGWKGAEIKATLESALHLPAFVDNDVRTMALAEAELGAGRDYAHLLCLTVGTGIGSAIIQHRQLWHGAHFTAGEFGYLLYQPQQNIEKTAAGPALEKAYALATGTHPPVNLREMVQRSLGGDQTATQVIAEGARAFGKTLAPVLLFLDPEAVIIGGGVAEIEDHLWWQPFIHAVREFEFSSVTNMPILKAELGNRAGMIGAGLLAWRHTNG